MAIKHTLNLSGKVQLICENEQNALYRTLAEKYKISIGSVSNPMAEYITVIDFNIKGA
jgi:hypothetical protein